MKHLFRLAALFLTAVSAQAQDLGELHVLAAKFVVPGVTSSFEVHEINQTTDTIEFIFQCELADTITHLGYLYSTRTGTPCAQQISLQGVNTSGRADGSIKAAGAAVATYTPPADATHNDTFQWRALGGSYACTRGEYLSAVIADVSDGCTPDGSNKSSYKYRQPNTWPGVTFPHTITIDGGAATQRNGMMVLGYKSATKAYGIPVETTSSHDFGLDSAVDERGNVISMPASVCETWTLKSFHVAGVLNCAGQSVKAVLYEGTTARQDVTIDCDSASSSSTGFQEYWFDEASLWEMDCGTSYRVAVQPQANGGTQTTMYHFTVDAASDMTAFPLGTAMYATQRVNGGAWTDETTKRNHINLIIGSMTPPAGGGGVVTSSGMSGNLQ